jgi:hypothetical protein
LFGSFFLVFFWSFFCFSDFFPFVIDMFCICIPLVMGGVFLIVRLFVSNNYKIYNLSLTCLFMQPFDIKFTYIHFFLHIDNFFFTYLHFLHIYNYIYIYTYGTTRLLLSVSL